MKHRTILLAFLLLLFSMSGVVLAADQLSRPAQRPALSGSGLQQQDLIPPNTTLTVGLPRYSADDLLWVAANTPHTLSGVDDVDPPSALQTSFRFYPVAAEANPPGFSRYTSPFNLAGPDGRYRIEFFSQDTAGNIEATKTRIEHLDSTPPRATWTLGTPVFYDDFGQPWVTDETLHTLAADDLTAPDGSPGSGLREIRFRITGAPAAPSAQFAVYEAPFVLDGPDGEYQIEFFAVDNVDNQGQTQSVQAFLDTTPPAVVIGGPYVGNEGTTFTFDAAGTFDAGSGLAEIAWDLDTDGAFDDALGPTATRTYGDDGSFFIGLQVTDNLGNSDIASTTVDVQNANPVVNITSISTPQPYPGQVITIEGSFTDAGWLDTHTVLVDWGDGQTTQATVTELNEAPEARGTFTAQHSYTAMGPFNITVTVTDDDGGTGTTSAQAEVGLSPQMPGTLLAADELTFYRLTGTTPNTWGSAKWQWRSGQGNPRYWWIGEGQGYLFLFLKSPNDAPYFDLSRPTEPWQNFLSIAVPREAFQRWFWCGIQLYDEHNRTIGNGCHPQWSPPPDGAGDLHPWIVQRMQEAEAHIVSIIQNSLQLP